MNTILAIMLLVLHVGPGEPISNALDKARSAYAENRETTTIILEPGTYYEEITVDVPGVRLINGAECRPGEQIAVRDGGVAIGDSTVRISWYYGHGYQYASMGPDRPNYGGSRERRWNASVLVTAPDFYAEGIVFENSFNMYVSPEEARDSLVDLSDAPFNWTDKERPKRRMPDRPKVAGSTEVQRKFYRERASAISFTSTATNAKLVNCRVVGRQDAFYGDHGASVSCEHCVLCGAVDYIFGGLELEVSDCELVAMVNTEKGDRCYIAAGRGWNEEMAGPFEVEKTVQDSIPADERNGYMRFRDCTVRYATADELENPGTADSAEPVWLARPWRWWGIHLFERVGAEDGVLGKEPVSLGLTKGHPAPYVRVE